MRRQAMWGALFLVLTTSEAAMGAPDLDLPRALAPVEPEHAVTEYLRYLYHGPSGADHLVATRELGVLYMRMGQFDRAARVLQAGRREAPGSEADRFDLLLALNSEHRWGPSVAQAKYDALIERLPPGPVRTEATKHLLWSQLRGGQYRAAIGTLHRVSDPATASMALRLQARQGQAVPDPERIRLYSALLPGAGQAVLGEWSQAAVSLLLNGALVAGLVYAWRAGDVPAGLVLLNYGPRYYLGGIKAAGELADAKLSAAHSSFVASLWETHPTLRPAE